MRLIDRYNPRKLYLQLVEIIEEAIERSELAVGSKLPTEDQLCSQQGVSKAVVRSAMQELARRGYVQKTAGRGTFVKKPTGNNGVWLYTNLTENVLDFGIEWDTEVVQKMVTVAPEDMSELFSMENGHQVFKVTRLRLIHDEPVVLETSYVSHGLCPGLPLEDLRSSSLLELITKKYGVHVSRCADSVEVTTLEEKEAELLRKKNSETALLADRILYTNNNRVVAFIRIISVSKLHRITFESVRTPNED